MDQNKIEWQPMPGKVIVKKIEDDRETFRKGGVILRPATAQQPRTTGYIIAVFEPFIETDGEQYDPVCKVGDLVIFGKHGGIEISYGDETVVCLRETEILTRVKVGDPEELSLVPGEFDTLHEETPDA